MNPSPTRGLRFVHPDFDQDHGSPGLRLGAHGLQMVEGAAAVRQAILLLLSTAPGERVMRPDYGCDLRRLAFSPNDATTAGLAVHYVRQALQRFEPRIDVLALDAQPHREDPGRLDILLEYRLRASGASARLVHGVQLSGETS